MVSNHSNVSLEMAVWLLFDEYDYVDMPNYISATSLMKPLRHNLLPSRVPDDQQIVPDVADYVSRALGNSIHAAVEKAWTKGHRLALQKLGYPKTVLDRVLINPTPEELAQHVSPFPVYIEQRGVREIDVGGIKYNIGGKFDMVAEGRVNDIKSTTAYTWLYGGKDDDYQLQGSIYRWIHPDKITEDHIRVHFVFTDWSKVAALQNPAYPQLRVLHKDIELLSLEETEAWIRWKVGQILKYRDADEKDIPDCTDKELWLSAPKFKYYSDPTKTTGKSSKNFDVLSEARAHLTEKGKGTIVTVPGTPKRCGYCPAFPICSQKDKYSHD